MPPQSSAGTGARLGRHHGPALHPHVHARASGPVRAGVVEAFLAHASDLMLLFDGDGTITWASPSARRLFGVEPAQLVGRNGFEMIHPDDQERALASLAGIQELGDQVCVEMRIVDPTGRVRWVEEVATNLLAEPEVRAVVGHLRDITERRAAQHEVRLQASLLDAVGQAIAAHDLEGVTTYWNEAATDLFGWTSDEALGRPMATLVAPAPTHRRLAVAAEAETRAGRCWSGEITVVAKDERVVPVHTSCTPILDEDGRHVGTIAASTDITEITEQRRRTEAERRRLAEAQASAHLGSFELDLRTGELLGSDELWQMLGREPCGLSRLEHIHPDDLPMFRQALRDAAEGRNDVACTHRIVRPDGVVRWVVSRTSEHHSAEADVLTGTVLDITERHEAEQALLHQATHDPLTGLANRRLFMAELDALLAEDPAGHADTVILFVDLDDFKGVNDRLGHIDADIVLRTLGERIAEALPVGATAGRLGGDEFVICTDGIGDDHDLDALVAEVHRAIREPLQLGDATIVMDASIGIARASTGRRAETVLRNADVALYAAKQAGGGRVGVFDGQLHQQDRRRRELIEELRLALDAGQLVTYFQPERVLATGGLFGFEALARWPHPTRGMVGPDEFIGLAEESGLIATLGRQMLECACQALAHWNELRPDLRLTVGVNVSPLQLTDPTFPDDVRRAVETHRVEDGLLCLEVTESTLMDAQVGTDVIQQLRALGVRIAIDDFGTGYSSFGRLKHMSVDFLKIDRSFVADIGQPADDVILSTMVNMARSLGVDVIAEGIETTAQHRFLDQAGCTYGQGYLWSKPLPEAETTALVEAEPRSTSEASAS